VNIKNKSVFKEATKLDWSLEKAEKQGFDHFMLKEIFEQPDSILDAVRGRIIEKEGMVKLGGLRDVKEKLANINRIIIVSCGTSYNAGLVGEYMLEEYAGIPVEVEYASEFRYRKPLIDKNTAVIAISQSGETADTLAAMELARENGAFIYGICNVVGSSIARATDSGTYTHAGPEIGVASTKAFTTQVAVLTMIALTLAKELGTISKERYKNTVKELSEITHKIEKILQLDKDIERISSVFTYARNFMYLGRGYNYPVALEGALKLKEISYIHAEGYPAAEMKHGPIALIDDEMPIVVISPKVKIYDKVVSNVQEIKARKGKIIAIVTEGDVDIKKMADFCIEIPSTDECLTPLLTVIPLQILSYYIASIKGRDVDQPRNLAKSVTVE
jgi:glucosamine--fructose-6-phosphate aminotransferase (isomerizing)